MSANGTGQGPIDTNASKDEKPDWQPLPVCTQTVNSNNDPLVGTSNDDVVRDTTISGAGGNDTLNGGPGTDTGLYPGSTAVRASLTTGFATGVGSDVLLAVENLTGSGANDRLTGSCAANTLIGGRTIWLVWRATTRSTRAMA
jgi:Ca2+-binding RTX toxin-like protein